MKIKRKHWLVALAGAALVGLYVNRGSIAGMALSVLEKFEGRENRAYRDTAGYWTIGVGHKILPHEMARYVGTPVRINGRERGSIVISEAEIDRLAAQDTATAQAAVARMVAVPISEAQRAALVSFVYNLGAGRLASSTLLRKLNAGDYAGAAAEFVKWGNETINGVLTPNRGLMARRQAERVMFERDIA